MQPPISSSSVSGADQCDAGGELLCPHRQSFQRHLLQIRPPAADQQIAGQCSGGRTFHARQQCRRAGRRRCRPPPDRPGHWHRPLAQGSERGCASANTSSGRRGRVKANHNIFVTPYQNGRINRRAATLEYPHRNPAQGRGQAQP
jgi:hypothetical protein